MGDPGWDAYVITRARTADTVWKFIERYVDQPAAEDRGDEQLMMLPLGGRHPEPMRLRGGTTPLEIGRRFGEGYDWEPAMTLTHALSRGLDQPYRAFMLYALPARLPEHLGITIGFTSDGGLILGAELPTRDGAAEWLERLCKEFHAVLGLVTDDHAPYSEAEARELIASGRAHLYWERGQATGREQ